MGGLLKMNSDAIWAFLALSGWAMFTYIVCTALLRKDDEDV